MQLNMEVGLLHTDKAWRQDYHIQLNREAELVNLIQATNIQQGEKYIGWTFFVHTVNICIQTQGRLLSHSHGMRDWGTWGVCVLVKECTFIYNILLDS